LFTKRCAKAGIDVSMGSRGDCFDNACCETFHATLKKERIYRQSWPTRAAARSAIFEYIEGWYNPRRRHSTLGYLSPAEFERLQAELARPALETAISDDGSIAATSPKASGGLTTRRVSPAGVDFVANGPTSPKNAPVVTGPRLPLLTAAGSKQKPEHRLGWPPACPQLRGSRSKRRAARRAWSSSIAETSSRLPDWSVAVGKTTQSFGASIGRGTPPSE
jgi:Integrase core domain